MTTYRYKNGQWRSMSVLYWSGKVTKGMQRFIHTKIVWKVFLFRFQGVSDPTGLKNNIEHTIDHSIYFRHICTYSALTKKWCLQSSKSKGNFLTKKKFLVTTHEMYMRDQNMTNTNRLVISCCLYCIKWHKNGITYMYVNTCTYTSITIHTACQSFILLILQKMIYRYTYPTPNIAFIPYHLQNWALNKLHIRLVQLSVVIKNGQVRQFLFKFLDIWREQDSVNRCNIPQHHQRLRKT